MQNSSSSFLENGPQTYSGTSNTGNIAEAIEAAILAAKESIPADFVTWELASIQGKSGGFIDISSVTVSIRATGPTVTHELATSQVLTAEYLKSHRSDNQTHYQQAGQLLSNALLDDAISIVKSLGASKRVVLTPVIEVTANDKAGCVTVTYTRADGTTLSYHRPT